MRFELLGPVRALTGNRSIRLGARRRRFVLAVLALEVNRVVPTSRLIDLVWPTDPPPSARAMIHTCVSGLRTALAEAGGQVTLLSEPPGYRLHCDPKRIDLHQFGALLDRARTCDDAQRLALLDEALGLWRGPAMAGVCTEETRIRLCGHLDNARLTAAEDRAEALLRLGRHDHGLIDELTALSGNHPHRQRLVAQLMLALHRAGRTTEALHRYQAIRRQLIDELGLDPGVDLQRSHQLILRGDSPPAATPTIGARRPGTVPSDPPAQLPADLPSFTGRAAELDRLLSMVPDGDQAAPTVLINAIDGMAGVGKTALAVHVAHRLASRFPDGQLFIDLHGFTQGVEPVRPADALDRMLGALGVPAERIPAHLDDRAALWRTTLRDKRMLILLDNANSETQVRPLLPGTAGCLVLITSRARLATLEDSHTLSLDIMPPDDALALFTHVVGQHRLAHEPPKLLTEIIELCARLPLAIRIAAARLNSRPHMTAAHLVERMRDHQERLTELRLGQRTVTASLDLSYRHLNDEERRAYGLLSLHPGSDIDMYAAAALFDITVVRVRRLLNDLTDAHLLRESAPGRYQLHDLVRAHARRTAACHESETDQHAALARLLEYYTHTALTAMRTLHPTEQSFRQQARTHPDLPAPALIDRASATTWLDTELPNLLAAVRIAVRDWHAHAIALSDVLHRRLRARSHYSVVHTLHVHALTMARHTGDRMGELTALNGLGTVYLLRGQNSSALDCFEQALHTAQAIGDRSGELNALLGIGGGHCSAGRHHRSIDCNQSALALARTSDHRRECGDALHNLGRAHRLLGRPGLAADCYQEAVDIAHAIGDHSGEILSLIGLGHTRRMQHRTGTATECYERALRVALDAGHRGGELTALNCLGHIHYVRGQFSSAASHHHRALDLARATGHRSGELTALNGVGQTLLATGHPLRAMACHETALDIAHDLGRRPDEARTLDSLGHVHHALDQHEQARRHWQQALTILTDLHISGIEDLNARNIRRHIATLALT